MATPFSPDAICDSRRISLPPQNRRGDSRTQVRIVSHSKRTISLSRRNAFTGTNRHTSKEENTRKPHADSPPRPPYGMLSNWQWVPPHCVARNTSVIIHLRSNKTLDSNTLYETYSIHITNCITKAIDYNTITPDPRVVPHQCSQFGTPRSPASAASITLNVVIVDLGTQGRSIRTCRIRQ